MSLTDRSDRYLVIGAGPAGLLAARALGHAGIPYDQLDRNPDVGGIWDIRNDWSPMYESAHFISSKTMSPLPGYPMPEHYPDYPGHRQIFAYLQSFARHYDLYRNLELETSVEWIDRDDGGAWRVRLRGGETRRYRGLFICSGNTWDPSWPDYPGEFTGETMHSVSYRNDEVFRGKRVLVVGGGNSGCDIACDAAIRADRAALSLRRAYHFIPKYIFGKPADVFADGVQLPRWLEVRVFELLLRFVVGDLRRYGLPRPDHRVMESHPILNTQVLHHIGHGDLAYRPDVARFEGKTVHFTDGSRDDFDLIVFATGYLVTYPFLDRSHFEWVGKYPDLFLSSLHREYDDVCCLGLHQTDGSAFAFFDMQADMMCNFILDQERDPARAERFRELKRSRPDLRGGLRYVDSDRHATYVKKAAFERYCLKVFRRFGWKRFGSEGRSTTRSLSDRVSPGGRALWDPRGSSGRVRSPLGPPRA